MQSRVLNAVKKEISDLGFDMSFSQNASNLLYIHIHDKGSVTSRGYLYLSFGSLSFSAKMYWDGEHVFRNNNSMGMYVGFDKQAQYDSFLNNLKNTLTAGD